jgi:hypothetical protein
MSAREIAARAKPRFIDTNPKPKTLEARLLWRVRLLLGRRQGSSRSHVGVAVERFTTPRSNSRSHGGLTAEQYRWKTIRKWGKR